MVAEDLLIRPSAIFSSKGGEEISLNEDKNDAYLHATLSSSGGEGRGEEEMNL